MTADKIASKNVFLYSGMKKYIIGINGVFPYNRLCR